MTQYNNTFKLLNYAMNISDVKSVFRKLRELQSTINRIIEKFRWMIKSLKMQSFVNFIKEQPADFSDETRFELVGHVNQQNFCIGDKKNPRIIYEKPTHPKRVSVWCGLCSGGVI